MTALRKLNLAKHATLALPAKKKRTGKVPVLKFKPTEQAFLPVLPF